MSWLRVRSRGGGDSEGSVLAQLATGFRTLIARPVAVAVIVFCALDSAVYGASSVLYVPMSIRLGTGPAGYSYLLAAAAFGGLLGAGLANRLSGVSRLAPVIMGSICLQALPFLVTGIPRTASVRTKMDSTLLRIDGEAFLSALQASRPSRSMVSVAGTRMARTPWIWPSAAWGASR
jgi:CRP-like cAMP-binding protein